MLALGTNDVMWGALQTGRVAATILSPPGTLFARQAGMNFMVDLTDLKLEYQGSTIATRRSLVQKNPALPLGQLRAIVKGVYLFKTRKEDTVRILGKFLGTRNREALEESWEYAAKMPAKPYAGGKCRSGSARSSGGRATLVCPVSTCRFHRCARPQRDRQKRLYRQTLRRSWNPRTLAAV